MSPCVNASEQLDRRPNLIFGVMRFSRSIARIVQATLDNLRLFPIVLCLMASPDSLAQTTAAAAAITGGVFVANSDGPAYIPGAKITLQGPETLQTETDEEGQYSFHKIQPGNYTIVARFPNLEAIQEVTIPAGTVTKMNLELKPLAVASSVGVPLPLVNPAPEMPSFKCGYLQDQ